MPGKSSYLELAKALGSSIILGVTAFIWGAAFSKADWRALVGLLAFSGAVCFLRADEKPGRKPVLLLIAALSMGGAVLVGIGAVPVDNVTGSYIAMLCPLSIAAILWQLQTTGYGRRRCVFLSFVIAALPAVFAHRSLLTSLGTAGILSLGFLMTLGSTLYLWGEPEGDFRARSAKWNLEKTFPAWLVFASSAVLTGLLVFLIAPFTFAAARAVIGFAARAFGRILIKLLEPTGSIAEYLIQLFRSLMSRNEDRPELDFGPGEWTERPVEPWEPPKSMAIVGYVLLALVCLLALWLLWRILRNRSDKAFHEDSDETSSDWSRQKALRWVLDTGKDLLASAADSAGKLLGARTTIRDPLLSAYSEFLSIAQKAGRKREPHETPMEFGESLASLISPVSTEVLRVSREFSRFFYGGITPKDEDIKGMREDIDSIKTYLSSHPSSGLSSNIPSNSSSTNPSKAAN